MDLGGEILISHVARGIKQRSLRQKCYFKGVYPVDSRLRRVVAGIGTVRIMSDENTSISEKTEEGQHIFRKSRITKDRDRGGLKTDPESLAAIDFIEHLQRCLASVHKGLTEDAESSLIHLMTEALENVNEHSGQSQWHLAGYLDDIDPENHWCEIVMFNFGKTIADTFKNLARESFPRKQISEYVNLHKTSGFFSKKWTDNDLITLAALQTDVSSKNTNIDSSRGQGTAKLIEFFQDLHDELNVKKNMKPLMAIISGNTYIFFDGTYRMEDNDEGRGIIAFNKDNNLKKAPDSNYVYNMGKTSFPGVFIGVRFFLPIVRKINES